jgi:hypothetical protein
MLILPPLIGRINANIEYIDTIPINMIINKL